MALLFAGNRWPGGKGIYDYHAEAEKLLTAMVHRSSHHSARSHGPHSVGPDDASRPPMILFVPEIMPEPFTDPSYHLPAFYEFWARWGPEGDRAFWAQAAATSRAFFVKTTNPQTGLAPSYANFDGTPHTNRFPQSGEFGYDAWRTASNWSVDWSWWQKAPESETERSHPAVFRVAGHQSIRASVFARRKGYWARRLDSRTRIIPPDWQEPTQWQVWRRLIASEQRIYRGAVEYADSVGPEPLLRRNALPDEPDAPERRVSHRCAQEIERLSPRFEAQARCVSVAVTFRRSAASSLTHRVPRPVV